MISEILTQISQLKIRLGELWDERGTMDQEILGLSMELDQLINQYYRMKKQQMGEF
jgi:hypothetical protein